MKFSRKTVRLIRRTIDEKWIPILKEGGKEKGSVDCLLCGVFLMGNRFCGNCPVAFFYEAGCHKTPFQTWRAHHDLLHLTDGFHRYIKCGECARIAQEEIDVLEEVYKRSLLFMEI